MERNSLIVSENKIQVKEQIKRKDEMASAVLCNCVKKEEEDILVKPVSDALVDDMAKHLFKICLSWKVHVVDWRMTLYLYP